MTLFKPTIALARILVLKNREAVVDLQFHAGLNIIRGENSAGKTTIIRFLAYALGAENISFNQTAQLCDEVLLQITANNVPVTLRRTISTATQQPLAIFWGPLDEATSASMAAWKIFPFRRSEQKESFSQVLFRLLEMPELRGDGGSNITMHQLLRLIYSDQESPTSEIFRSDKFDPAITRAAVGDYLLGIDESELYDLRLNENSLEKQLTEAKGAIRTIYATFGASGTDISPDFINDRINTLASELTELKRKLDSIGQATATEKNTTSATSEDETLRERLDATHAQLSALKRRKMELEAEISDSALFINEINERLNSLDESSIAETYLGAAAFAFCPSCFSKIEKSDPTAGFCSLCKSRITPESAKSQLARMRNELALQQRESNLIRSKQLLEIEQANRTMPALETQLKSLEEDFKRNVSHWRPPEQIEIQRLSREVGSKEQEIRNTLELKKLADLLDANNEKSGELEAKLAWVRGRIEAVRNEQTHRREVAYLAVAENFIEMLKGDLPRQTEFSTATSIDIDFGANRVSVDGHQQFSASSMVYLKHSFHIALLLTSTEQSFFRFPRFVIVDGVEDGGMEPERSFNFQKLIQQKSKSIEVEHQIILATAHICPELDIPEFVVGQTFSHDKKSINFD